jgi:hypothetical protein
MVDIETNIFSVILLDNVNINIIIAIPNKECPLNIWSIHESREFNLNHFTFAAVNILLFIHVFLRTEKTFYYNRIIKNKFKNFIIFKTIYDYLSIA